MAGAWAAAGQPASIVLLPFGALGKAARPLGKCLSMPRHVQPLFCNCPTASFVLVARPSPLRLSLSRSYYTSPFHNSYLSINLLPKALACRKRPTSPHLATVTLTTGSSYATNNTTEKLARTPVQCSEQRPFRHNSSTIELLHLNIFTTDPSHAATAFRLTPPHDLYLPEPSQCLRFRFQCLTG